MLVLYKHIKENENLMPSINVKPKALEKKQKRIYLDVCSMIQLRS